MNSHLPAGRLVARLDALPRGRAWFAIVLALAALAIADDRLRFLGLTPLYTPIVCVACWTLGTRPGFIVALAATVVAVVPHLSDEPYHPITILYVRAAVPIATYLLTAAIVISFRQSFDREHYLARRDRLTGALNKHAFHERAETLLNSGECGGDTLVLAILDLDDFKTLNNVHGHAAGDAVLHVLGKRALAMLRPEDVFGRIGGDEFAFLVAVRSAEEGERFALILHEWLSRALKATQHPVTCSMGVLLIPPRSFRSAAELLDAADQAMYRVKRAGKDALQIAHAGPQPRSSPTASARGRELMA